MDFREQPVRTMLWRYHLGGGCVLALAYVYLPFPVLRIGSLVALCLVTIAATLASIRLGGRPGHGPSSCSRPGRRSGSWPGPSGRRRP